MRFLIYLVLAYVAYRVLKSFLGSGKKVQERRESSSQVIDEMIQDPYCKTYIPRREAVERIIEGKPIFFCSDQCASRYQLEEKSKVDS